MERNIALRNKWAGAERGGGGDLRRWSCPPWPTLRQIGTHWINKPSQSPGQPYRIRKNNNSSSSSSNETETGKGGQYRRRRRRRWMGRWAGWGRGAGDRARMRRRAPAAATRRPWHRHLLSRVRGERGSVRLLRTATARLHLIREEAKKQKWGIQPDRTGSEGLSTLPPPPLHKYFVRFRFRPGVWSGAGRSDAS